MADGTPAKGSAKMSSTFIYVGPAWQNFTDEFERYGRIFAPQEAMQDMLLAYKNGWIE